MMLYALRDFVTHLFDCIALLLIEPRSLKDTRI